VRPADDRLSARRFRRASLSWPHASGERRQQLKWLACGAAITVCVGSETR
jgi:hypothetical protein